MPLCELWDPALYTTGPQRIHLLLCQVMDIQISVPAVDPAVVHELAPYPLSHGLGVPGKQYLRQASVDERPMWKS